MHVDATDVEVEMVVNEEQFGEIRVGDAAKEVEKVLGKPKKQTAGLPGTEVWEYRPMRGEPPSLFRTLIRREMPEMEFCASQVSIHDGRVVSTEILNCKDWREIEKPEPAPSN